MQAAAEKERSDLKAKLTDVESAAVISSNQRDALQRVHTYVYVWCVHAYISVSTHTCTAPHRATAYLYTYVERDLFGQICTYIRIYLYSSVNPKVIKKLIKRNTTNS